MGKLCYRISEYEDNKRRAVHVSSIKARKEAREVMKWPKFVTLKIGRRVLFFNMNIFLKLYSSFLNSL